MIVVAVILGACAGDPLTTHVAESPTADQTAAAPTASRELTTPAPLEDVRIQPGTPYEGAELLDAMRASRRPGGVPAEIVTPDVADRVAESLWTIDGERWTAYSVGGACGPAACSLEVVGVRDDADGEDVWSFQINPTSGQVEVVDRDLGATPAVVMAALDRMARELLGPDLPEEVFLASARWMPPPDEAAFTLSYRTGDEEESCAVDAELDGTRRKLIEVTATDC